MVLAGSAGNAGPKAVASMRSIIAIKSNNAAIIFISLFAGMRCSAPAPIQAANMPPAIIDKIMSA